MDWVSTVCSVDPSVPCELGEQGAWWALEPCSHRVLLQEDHGSQSVVPSVMGTVGTSLPSASPEGPSDLSKVTQWPAELGPQCGPWMLQTQGSFPVVFDHT